MALKNDLKQDVRGFGKAFTAFGKGFVRSVKQVAGTAVNKTVAPEASRPESNVFKDGTWRETAREFGQAFKNVGHTVSDAVNGRNTAPAENTASAEQAVQAVQETVEKTAVLIDSALLEQTEALQKLDEENSDTVQD